jgi:omega-amidase
MADNLRISMVQSHIIWEDRDENLGYYGELLRRVSGKTDIAVLPETFTTGFSMDVEKLADTMDGPTIPTIKRWAKKYNVKQFAESILFPVKQFLHFMISLK